MNEILGIVPTVLIATAGGYLLGALPLAYLISRRHSGVDIFEVGNGLPGASNVRRNVGKVPAVMVLTGDMAKGAMAILLADFMGVESPWILLPAGAAVVGHWRSMFTGFRGGDGLATLGGSIFGLFPVIGFISLAVASLVALGGQKIPYSSLFSIVFGYGTLTALTVYYDGDTTLVFGMGGLSGLVLAHALLGHRRRRNVPEWDDIGESTGVTEQP